MEEEYPLLVRPRRDTRPSMAFVDGTMVARKADVRMPRQHLTFTCFHSIPLPVLRITSTERFRSRREDHLREKSKVLTVRDKHTSNGDHSVQRLLLGTHTAPGDRNYLMIADVKIPTDEAAFDARKYDDQRGEVGGFGAATGCKIEIKQRINHEGEVHRYVFYAFYLHHMANKARN